MSFSEHAWLSVAPWFGAICDHPFVTGLADGTLDDDVFVRYLLDDSHYLDRYARVLATRERLCDLGYLRIPYLRDVGTVATAVRPSRWTTIWRRAASSRTPWGACACATP